MKTLLLKIYLWDKLSKYRVVKTESERGISFHSEQRRPYNWWWDFLQYHYDEELAIAAIESRSRGSREFWVNEFSKKRQVVCET